jgi:hypothetical protein
VASLWVVGYVNSLLSHGLLCENTYMSQVVVDNLLHSVQVFDSCDKLLVLYLLDLLLLSLICFLDCLRVVYYTEALDYILVVHYCTMVMLHTNVHYYIMVELQNFAHFYITVVLQTIVCCYTMVVVLIKIGCH